MSGVLGVLTEMAVTADMGGSRGVRVCLASLLWMVKEMGVT